MLRVAVVTGANRGIGRAVVDRLAADGLHVVVTARDGEAAAEVAAAVRAGGGAASSHALDVTDDASVEALAAWVDATHGRWDVLVSNAGVLPDDHGASALLADPSALAHAFDVNGVGAWRMARAAVPRMQAGGYGRIVHVSTGMAGLNEMGRGAPAYRMSKVALNGLTRLLAAELGPSPIKVNSVCPGWVRTDMGGARATRAPEEGAASVVWAVHLPADGPTGGFFRDGVALDW